MRQKKDNFLRVFPCMRYHRFFIKEPIPDEGIFILENEEIVHQLLRVLKIKRGEKIVLFNGSGFDFVTREDKLAGRFFSGKIIEKVKNESDPKIEVHLYQSLIKKDKFEWVLGKGTELGVKFFHPVVSEHSIKTGFSMERACRIVKEATEQSGQDRVPEIKEAVKFVKALDDIAKDSANFIFDPSGALKDFKIKNGPVNIFIGPEGGFSEKELKQAKDAGLVRVSFGPRILRSETASIVASAFYLTPARE